MARRALNGLRVIVTGASQGIGRALAIDAAKRGCRVVAAARTPELLNELVNDVPAIVPCVADVTDPAGRQMMIDAAVKAFSGLDVLINNAGVGANVRFMDSDPDTLRTIFETNYFGLCELTRMAIPHLKTGVTPAIVNISSVLGRRSFPGVGLYAASKFAVAGFSEAIRSELAKDGIDVLVVNPGLTETNFGKNMLDAKAEMPTKSIPRMSAEAAAAATLDALAKGKAEITLTARGKLLVLATRFVPWFVEYYARKKM